VIGLGHTVPTSSGGTPQQSGFGSTLPMPDNTPQPGAYGPVTQPARPSSFRPPEAAPATAASAQMQAPTQGAVPPEHRYSSDDLEADVRSAGLPRRARARWVFALVIAAMVVLVGVTVGRRYIATSSKPAASAAPVRDERVAQLLKEAVRLLDQGAFEDAKEQLDKAAVLADKDPQVLAMSARLESVRADTEWLRLRLLDPTNEDLVRSTHRELGARVGRAEAALGRAARAASDPVVARASIDVLRMKGDLAQARSKASAISAASKDNAYVLAALDLAEDTPAYGAVVDRLRPVASVDSDARRAQAALIYALARDGRQADAEAELEKVKSESSPHPLLAELENFVGRMRAALDAGKAAPSASVAALDPRALGALDTSPMPPGGATPPAAPGDFRATLKQAADAARSGNASRAEQLYQAVLTQHPGDTEALTGLGDLAKSHGDLAKAGSYYEQVLKQNPSYLPALMGSADQKWASGDRKGAVALYRRVVEQAGSGSTYFQRAQSRIKEFEAPAAAPTAAAQPKPTSTAAPTPPPAAPGDIDTTDLKGIE
jgi:tetratricopeptide (TPR) repeat protein